MAHATDSVRSARLIPKDDRLSLNYQIIRVIFHHQFRPRNQIRERLSFRTLTDEFYRNNIFWVIS